VFISCQAGQAWRRPGTASAVINAKNPTSHANLLIKRILSCAYSIRHGDIVQRRAVHGVRRFIAAFGHKSGDESPHSKRGLVSATRDNGHDMRRCFLGTRSSKDVNVQQRSQQIHMGAPHAGGARVPQKSRTII
jgi:hypothetical protein